jgi:O-antigen/teichoic acid export membrane protein
LGQPGRWASLSRVFAGSARRQTAAQAGLYAASVAGIGVLGVASQALLTRLLSVSDFGTYGFSISFLQFVAILFEFGLFVPAARLAARSALDARREITGAALLLYVPVGVLFCLTIFGLSFVVDHVFAVNAALPLRAVSAVAFVFPFALIGLQLAQGQDRLHVYSISSVVGQVLMLASVAAIFVTTDHLTTSAAVVLRAVTLGAGWAILCWWLRPRLAGPAGYARRLIAEARDWGFGVYVGRVLSIGTYRMDVLMLAAYTDATAVAYYTLAGALAASVGLPATGVATALFPRMATQEGIRRRWLLFAWGVSLSAALALTAAAGWLVPTIFSSSYQGAVVLVLPLALAEALRGVTGVYNQYLAAQGLGRPLRNAGLILTGSNLAANFALIPPFGASGAAWASVLALVANLAAHIVGYRASRQVGVESR